SFVCSGNSLANNGDDGVDDGNGIHLNNLANPAGIINLTKCGSIPYIVRADDLNIFPSSTLNIPAGTVIKFEANQISGIHVQGTLNVQGTAQDKVVFTSINDNTVAPGTDPNNSPVFRGDWDAIHIDQVDGSAAITLNYAEIRYG